MKIKRTCPAAKEHHHIRIFTQLIHFRFPYRELNNVPDTIQLIQTSP